MSNNDTEVILQAIGNFGKQVNLQVAQLDNRMGKMEDAIIALARAEEKLIAFETNVSKIVEDAKADSKRVDVLEDDVIVLNAAHRTISRITWALVFGVVAEVLGVATYFIIKLIEGGM